MTIHCHSEMTCENGNLARTINSRVMDTLSVSNVPSADGSSQSRTRLYSIGSIFDEDRWAIQALVKHKDRERYKQMGKMLLVVLVPVLALVAIATILLSQGVVKHRNATRARHNLNCLFQMGGVVEALQRERELLVEKVLRAEATGDDDSQLPLFHTVSQLSSTIRGLSCWPQDGLHISNITQIQTKEELMKFMIEFSMALWTSQPHSLRSNRIQRFYSAVVGVMIDWGDHAILLPDQQTSAVIWLRVLSHNIILRLRDILEEQKVMVTELFLPCQYDALDRRKLTLLEGRKRSFYDLIHTYMYGTDIVPPSMYDISPLMQLIEDADESASCHDVPVHDYFVTTLTQLQEEVDRYSILRNNLSAHIQNELQILQDKAHEEIMIFSFIAAGISVGCVAISLWYATCIQRLTQKISLYALKTSEKSKQLANEKKRTDALISQMLPPTVAEQLKERRQVTAEYYDSVTIYFSDIVGFTSLSSVSTPHQVVDLLNGLYSMFDGTIERYDVYKVETIGDAYMVVSGLPCTNEHHVTEIANMALDILQSVKDYVIPHLPHQKLAIRIGCHTGACVAGVVGTKMPRYCLFGDTVNVASRMESTSEAQCIQVTEAMRKVLVDSGGFVLSKRGEVDVKGKGMMVTYWLVGRDGSNHIATRHRRTPTIKINGRPIHEPLNRTASGKVSGDRSSNQSEEMDSLLPSNDQIRPLHHSDVESGLDASHCE